LAKAALYAGARLLMDEMGVDKVDRVTLAGAFGAHISPKHAMVLGMIPDAPLDKVTSAGNAAGTGARIALCNVGSRDAIEETVHHIHKVETAIEPRRNTSLTPPPSRMPPTASRIWTASRTCRKTTSTPMPVAKDVAAAAADRSSSSLRKYPTGVATLPCKVAWGCETPTPRPAKSLDLSHPITTLRAWMIRSLT
jgi:hypothetical protein